MAHCYYHALSSVRKWGGTSDDYLALHQWFDESKAIFADPRHRALRHHAEGIFMLETLFGATITNSDGKHCSGPAYRRAACHRGLRLHPFLCGLGPPYPAADLDAERAPIGPAGERCTARGSRHQRCQSALQHKPGFVLGVMIAHQGMFAMSLDRVE
jgi:hypothetical protein